MKFNAKLTMDSNQPYACGWCVRVDSKSKVYVEWLIKGWEYLNDNFREKTL
jgi:hypothetical protein